MEQTQYGCSIMSNAWTNRKARTLINFLVNTLGGTIFVRSIDGGTIFVRSIDGSSFMKTKWKIFELLNTFVIMSRRFLVGFIYNHTITLNIMRKFTQKVELVRNGVTRFATTFLNLQRLYKQKNNMIRMFVSEEWVNTKALKYPKGKMTYSIIINVSFWNDVIFSQGDEVVGACFKTG
ncbi:uncharacterized protein [Cicer arietinum]|uniref:uncharacterized protein n=1 Tax=Cicer arietinum TaxID=3827 RepID=UPI003CC6A340